MLLLITDLESDIQSEVKELNGSSVEISEAGNKMKVDGILTESPVADDDIVFRSSLVKLMIISLQCWEQSTGKSKIDLAERSKLWRVSVNNGQLRVSTMERYLTINKLPKVPRWHQVIKTAYFVLEHSKPELSIYNELKKALNKVLESK